MNKLIKKTSALLLATSLLNLASPVATVLAEENIPQTIEQVKTNKSVVISDSEGNIIRPTINEDLVKAGQKLEAYFYVQEDGSIGLKGSPKELSQLLNISETDAQLYFEAVKELPNVYQKGAVGIRFNLGPHVRGLNGWAAGAFAAGYAGWHLKQFAVNPATAGVVAVISGAIAAVVKAAVESHKTTTLAVVYIPGVELVYTVNVP
ncbi:hypothetical protein ACVRZD_09360 [Streptococcus hongkongensis]|nr:hypothetical protein NC01_07135 [Streptococcus uberis]